MVRSWTPSISHKIVSIIFVNNSTKHYGSYFKINPLSLTLYQSNSTYIKTSCWYSTRTYSTLSLHLPMSLSISPQTSSMSLFSLNSLTNYS